MKATTEVVTVGPEMEVLEVARLLLAYRVSAAPVVDSAGHVLGMASGSPMMEAMNKMNKAMAAARSTR